MAVEAVVDSGGKSEFPFWNSMSRKFPPDSSFFFSGDLERQFLSKQVALDMTEDDKRQMLTEDLERSISCPIVGCDAQLKSLEGFEDHYNARHTASCSVCSRVYPTERLLSIHVSEMHDSFFQAKVARGFAMSNNYTTSLPYCHNGSCKLRGKGGRMYAALLPHVQHREAVSE